MLDVQARINAYIAKMGAVRDGIGGMFASYLCIPEGESQWYFGSSAGSILNNPNNFNYTFWQETRRILTMPYDEITPKQYWFLATNFVKVSDNLAGKERFLNMFLERVELPERSVNMFNVIPYSICPNKVAGVQMFLEGGIAGLLINQGRYDARSNEYNLLEVQRDDLKQLTALLTVINSLTSPPSTEAPFVQHVIIQKEGRLPITLGEHNTGIDVLFARGEILRDPRLAPGGTAIESVPFALWPANLTIPQGYATHMNSLGFQGQPSTDWINSGTISIGRTLDGIGTGTDFGYYLQEYFVKRHRFDATSHVTGEILNIVAGELFGAIGSAAGLIASIIDSGFGTFAAMQNAINIQNDLITITEYGYFGRFQDHFNLRGIVITQEGQMPQLLSWPTTTTATAINALNWTYAANSIDNITRDSRRDLVTQTAFTESDLAQNFDAIFNAYFALNGRGTQFFGRHANASNNRPAEEHTSIPASPNDGNTPTPTPQ